MCNWQLVRFFLFGVLFVFVMSCSNSDDPMDPVTPSDQSFSTPDPSANTVVARLSYPVVRDAVDELLSHEYLNLYLDIDDELLTGNLHSGTEPSTLSCPGGGTVSCISNGCIYPLSELSYDNCVIDSSTLTGTVERRGTSFPFASGGSMTLEEAFDNFSIDAGANGKVEFSGNVKRSVVDSQFDTGVAREITKTSAVEVVISSSRVETDSNVSQLNGNYTETTTEKTVVNADESITRSSVFSFEGEASILSDQFGTAEVTASKTGTLVAGNSQTESVPAMLSADFGDTSTIAVTTTADTDDSVQVDIVSGDVSVSLVDTYIFDARLSALE